MEPSQTPALPERRAKFWIGGAIIVAAIAGLIWLAMTQPGAASNYTTPSELGSTTTTEQVQLAGKVAPGSIDRDGLTTTFVVTDGDTDIEVTTDSPMPDAFRESSEVVATGTFDGEVFAATRVLAKCPSKFKAKV
jgi:cytochrome c-type biogenesis protein CcmE